MSQAARLGLATLALIGSAFTSRAETGGPLVDAVPSITVEGEASREVAPDLALVTLGVVTDRPTAAQAMTDNAAAAAAVVAAARSAGLGDADIRTATLSLSGLTDQRDATKVRAFQARNQVTLRVRHLGNLSALIGNLTDKGANAVDGIGFTVDNPQPVLDELRTGATRDAARKADLYARAAGVKLGRILRIQPDGASAPTPMPRSYKLAAAAPAPPVEGGTESLEARVQITWEVLP